MRLARGSAAILVVFLAVVAVGAAMRAPDDPGAPHAAVPEPAPADPPPPGSMGPLRVHEQNPRYFADKSGRPVYLTGSHVWWNRLDRTWKAAACASQAGRFDYEAYLRAGRCSSKTSRGTGTRTRSTRGGAVRSFTASFDGPAVLWLRLVSRP